MPEPVNTPDICPFCEPDSARIVHSEPECLALRDGFPVSPGHTLVVPRRHVASIFELNEEEWGAVWSMVGVVRRELAKEEVPDGFNIGVNDGTAAGQTIAHAHVHVIPRRTGDVEDPRGGVRWVIPAKVRYW
jgi:diadenosine tetraphosphate (Ap4A) HIT family hydrolase